MSSPASPYRELGINARLTGRDKRRKSPPAMYQKLPGFGHYFELGTMGKFDKNGNRIGKDYAMAQVCRYCKQPWFAVAGSDCKKQKKFRPHVTEMGRRNKISTPGEHL